MNDDALHRALSHDEQWAAYDRAMQTFETLKARWIADGKLGPPPPRPVRPHTPGFNPQLPASQPGPDHLEEYP